jgi:rhomboid family GlyGly-CTERM serine protease
VLIWALFGKYLSVAYWLLVLTVSCLLTSAGLLLFNPQLQWYVGLSGVLHGLFIVGSIYDIKSGRLDANLLLLAVCLKLVWEQVAGPLPGSESTAGGNVIVDAHLYGAVSGAIIALGFHLPRLLAKKAK